MVQPCCARCCWAAAGAPPLRPQKAPLRSSSDAGRRAPSGGLMQLAPGESVRHDAFGQGMVLSVRVMGNDALIEVAFDTVGTKKLMLRAAMGHLSKG